MVVFSNEQAHWTHEFTTANWLRPGAKVLDLTQLSQQHYPAQDQYMARCCLSLLKRRHQFRLQRRRAQDFQGDVR